MISPRFAAPVAALLLLALVPTLIHSYGRVTISDGLRASAIPAVLKGMSSSPTGRRPGWVQHNFDTDDWVERIYTAGQQDVVLFVARSYDAKRLYHHPELALLRASQPTPSGIARPTARPDIPLHLIEITQDGQTGLAVYALRYDEAFIASPILFQLRMSASLLFRGRKPLTLFMASDRAGRVESLDEAPATRVLVAAIEAFEHQVPAERSGR